MPDEITSYVLLLTALIGLMKVCIEYQIAKVKKAEAKGKSKHSKRRPSANKTSFRK